MSAPGSGYAAGQYLAAMIKGTGFALTKSARGARHCAAQLGKREQRLNRHHQDFAPDSLPKEYGDNTYLDKHNRDHP